MQKQIEVGMDLHMKSTKRASTEGFNSDVLYLHAPKAAYTSRYPVHPSRSAGY